MAADTVTVPREAILDAMGALSAAEEVLCSIEQRDSHPAGTTFLHALDKLEAAAFGENPPGADDLHDEVLLRGWRIAADALDALADEADPDLRSQAATLRNRTIEAPTAPPALTVDDLIANFQRRISEVRGQWKTLDRTSATPETLKELDRIAAEMDALDEEMRGVQKSRVAADGGNDA